MNYTTGNIGNHLKWYEVIRDSKTLSEMSQLGKKHTISDIKNAIEIINEGFRTSNFEGFSVSIGDEINPETEKALRGVLSVLCPETEGLDTDRRDLTILPPWLKEQPLNKRLSKPKKATLDPDLELKTKEAYETFIERQGHNIKTKHSAMTWKKEFEKLYRIDKLPHEDVLNIIIALPKMNFWAGVILSPKNFRKNYNRLRIEAKKTGTQLSNEDTHTSGVKGVGE